MDLDEHYSGEGKKKNLKSVEQSCATVNSGISVEMLHDFGPLLSKIGVRPY